MTNELIAAVDLQQDDLPWTDVALPGHGMTQCWHGKRRATHDMTHGAHSGRAVRVPFACTALHCLGCASAAIAALHCIPSA